MDITSPITLWKDYDVLALPLNISSLSDKTEQGITVKSYYFDGYTTVDGRVRTFIKILENPNAKGVVLYLPDSADSPDDNEKRLFDMGYTVATLDYLGKSDKTYYTMYPRSLAHCNLSGVKVFTIPDGVLSNWYIWTCLSRRAVKLLGNLYPDKKLFALGVGLGGSTVYKLSTFDDGLTACATLLNILPRIESSGNPLINYHASLDNIAYAPFGIIPLFMAVSSNDEDESFDEMSELAKDTVSLKHFRIVERAFAGGIVAAYNDLSAFFDSMAMGVTNKPLPTLTAVNSEGNLYFNIDISNSELLAENSQLNLYVSFCIEDSTYRNWMSVPIISLGNDKAMAHINVCNVDKPIHGFANLVTADGVVYSSELLNVLPKTLGVRFHAGITHRRIYDGSMGKDCWTSYDGGKIQTVKGPFDIDGVSCTTNNIITFKLGDPLFKVSADTILQIMVNGKPQKLTAVVADKTNRYYCDLDIQNEDNWQNFSLSHMNFKGPSGMLSDWSEIKILAFKSTENFIIGSVLWV